MVVSSNEVPPTHAAIRLAGPGVNPEVVER
jgi:hypothetical protein